MKAKGTRKPAYYSDEKYGSLFGEYLRALQRVGRPIPKLRRTPRRVSFPAGSVPPGGPSLKIPGLATSRRAPWCEGHKLTTPSASAMGPGSAVIGCPGDKRGRHDNHKS